MAAVDLLIYAQQIDEFNLVEEVREVLETTNTD